MTDNNSSVRAPYAPAPANQAVERPQFNPRLDLVPGGAFIPGTLFSTERPA